MNARVRLFMVVIGALGLAASLARGISGLNAFGKYPGPYGDMINHLAPYQRQVTNVVAAVNFDYRGLDTLGEEMTLFAAISGLVLLLRGDRGEPISAPPLQLGNRAITPRSEAAHWLGIIFIALLFVFGFYMILHGQLTPGGGFQGGTIVGTATMLIYLAVDYATYRRSLPKRFLEIVESIGAGSYVLIGLASMIAGGAFLENFLPLGQRDRFFSGGTIWLINFAVGLEVASGFALLFAEFLEETRQRETGEEK